MVAMLHINAIVIVFNSSKTLFFLLTQEAEETRRRDSY